MKQSSRSKAPDRKSARTLPPIPAMTNVETDRRAATQNIVLNQLRLLFPGGGFHDVEVELGEDRDGDPVWRIEVSLDWARTNPTAEQKLDLIGRVRDQLAAIGDQAFPIVSLASIPGGGPANAAS